MTPTPPKKPWLLLPAVLTLMFGGAAVAQDPPQSEGVKYSVSIDGSPSKRVTSLIDEVSQLKLLADRPPASRLGVRRRAEADEGRIRDVLKSEGYFNALVRTSLTAEDPGAKVQILIEPGPQYTVSTATLETVVGDDVVPGAEKAVTQLAGQPARAEAILNAEDAVLGSYRNNGYHFAALQDRAAVVNHTRSTLDVTVRVDPGPRVVFGPVEISGLETIEPQLIRRLVPWEEGTPFKESLVAEYRKRLIDTGLVASVKVTPSSRKPDQDGAPLPINVTVREAAHRTISVGGKYSRDEGFGGRVQWQHRNIFGRGEKLTIEGRAAEIEQRLLFQVEKPNFRQYRQTIGGSLELAREETDAYKELSADTGIFLERPLWTNWTGRVGAGFEYAEVTDSDGARQSALVSGPVVLSRDTTKSLLDPVQGMRLSVEVTPYAGAFGGGLFFLKSELEASTYLALDEGNRVAAAARAKVGVLNGAALSSIPASKRFYGGGGGSVRGYGFQKIGPLDDDLNPTGGASVFEASVEARIKITETIGVVPFVDAGTVSREHWPDFSESVRWAAGIGGRYHTPVGPLRLDIGFPLNRRAGVDDAWQFYISFGQAF